MEKNEKDIGIVTYDLTPRDISVDFLTPDIRVKEKVEEPHVDGVFRGIPLN